MDRWSPRSEPPPPLDGWAFEVLMDDGSVERAAHFQPDNDVAGAWLHPTAGEEPGEDCRQICGWRVSR